MSALSPDTAIRVAKIVPTLSSDKAGEVAAAAAAIDRALTAGGSDWHDLGDAIRRRGGREPVARQNREARSEYVTLAPTQRAAVLVALRRGLDSPRLSRWEHDFVVSILERLEDSRAQLSRRQAEAVDRVLTKLAGGGR